MASTPEAKAKSAVKKLLLRLGYELGIDYALMSNAAGGVGFSTGRADSTLYWRATHNLAAIPVELEVKAKDNYPTPRQKIMLEAAHKAGAHALVIWGDRQADLDYLERFLTTLTHHTEPVLKLGKAK